MLKPDLLIVGAGPAGMSAAIVAARAGLKVVVVDEQPTPGGQIWRGVEANAGTSRGRALGSQYCSGLATVRAFRECGAVYWPSTRVWQIEPTLGTYVTGPGGTRVIAPRLVLIATGAQERPAPFRGWTLPGVMTVGAAQILLKNPGSVPSEPVWIAGCGPLALLYAHQLIRMGGAVAGFLDTRPSTPLRESLRLAGRAVLRSSGELAKGMSWYAGLRHRAGRYVPGVVDLQALGTDRLEGVRYRTAAGRLAEIRTSLLLVHEGVLPELHTARSLGCEIQWDAGQAAYRPVLNEWGECSHPDILIAGDAAGIGGAEAAVHRGRLSALRILQRLGKVAAEPGMTEESCRAALARALALRPFLDRVFRPRGEIFAPDDDTIVCRCEELRVRDLRTVLAGSVGPNQLKAFTRAGMGSCQGRQCGLTVAALIAAAEGRQMGEVQPFRVRPPLKPVRLCDLAGLADEGLSS
ncbi:MAG: NAD(P)/FAD-dependent oxidoreductase [Gluconobacter potus]|uniref:FAD-dependent oxidoreductase n=1 Tax=Gluconobacter potus TaxID=2724927 RepID=A0ABR9YJP0_9PROT|nr:MULTISPECIES: NAD(P)/FAD-dependent oxidoreductase [Gluconobacter]MBF0864270.1 FAD-dependent oxidoreductase [Gluconobacter sp. R71656]MBF0867848.1 FAD-dependent oxidoreductase [Gluconobacter sp. R75628]MBF0872773.1 FAD-dependent oxidoreductase [Gluconobacter sp. R75629]MBF0882019.1 FAD-dependent oxidoreductase [Gluconobacter potus]